MGRIARGAAIAWGVLALWAVPAMAAGEQVEPPFVFAATPDGSSVLFRTYEPLAAEDTDTYEDLYVWKGGENRLVTTAPVSGPNAGGPGGSYLSDDGERVVFVSYEHLTAADNDFAYDVYERSGGRTTLVSTGPTDPGLAGSSSYAGQAGSGRVVFFRTESRMVAADDDDAQDVYRRENGVTTLVSTDGAGHNAPAPVTVEAISPAGRLVFSTTDALLPEDRDGGKVDAYARDDGGSLELVTKGNAVGSAADAPVRSVTPDARSVVFETTDRLTARDLDVRPDLYQRRNGQTTLVSADANGYSRPCAALDTNNPEGACDPWAVAQSPSGDNVVFSTEEPLVTEDTNNDRDLYDRHGTSTDWLSVGPGGSGSWGDGAIADGGARALIATDRALLAEDADHFENDVYQRTPDGAVKLLSTGPADPGGGYGDVWLRGYTTDLRHVFFDDPAPLVPEDTDGVSDLYESSGGVTRLVSTGPADAHGDGGIGLARGRFSADGRHVFFVTDARLTADDADSDPDVCMRAGGQTTLLTPG